MLEEKDIVYYVELDDLATIFPEQKIVNKNGLIYQEFLIIVHFYCSFFMIVV